MIAMKKSEALEQPESNRVGVFSTHDLALAAFLVTSSHKLLKLDRANPKKVSFLFERTESIDHDVEHYWANQIKVNPRAYFDDLRMLKNRIYSD